MSELPFWSINKETEVKLRLDESGDAALAQAAALPSSTVISSFYKNVNEYSNKPALYQKRVVKVDPNAKINPFTACTSAEPGTIRWKSWTWEEYKTNVDLFAKALISVGIRPFDVVNIMGFNAPEWFFANFGSMAAGGISAGIYATNNAEACKYITDHSKAKVVIVDGNTQLEKYAGIVNQLPELEVIVVYGTDEISYSVKESIKDAVTVYTFEEFQELGKDISDATLQQRIEAQKPNQTCALIYTSGTTGSPKAVMITNDNICWTTQTLLTQLPRPLNSYDSIVSYLPLSHIAAQVNDLYAPIFTGMQVWFAQPDALRGTLVETLKEVRPTIFFGVPRVWEKIYMKMQEVASTITGYKKTLSTWSKSHSLAYHKSTQFSELSQTSTCSTSTIFYPFAKLILHKVHVSLGLDKCIACFVGAAPIEPKILEYFASIDLPIYDVFGQSECTGPHAINTAKAWQIGTCGRALPGTETKIIEETGELCYRGRHIFAGYMGKEEETSDTIDNEGWLHSGDTAKITDGFITITGRIKELIITAGGENVAPVLIEDQFKLAMTALSNCMVIGDERKFLSILLCIQVEIDDNGNPTDKLCGEALLISKAIGSEATTSTEANKCEKWKEYFNKGMEEANKKAASRAQNIQKFTLLSTDFSENGGEFTPTLKLKRKITAEKYKDVIERMYQEKKVESKKENHTVTEAESEKEAPQSEIKASESEKEALLQLSSVLQNVAAPKEKVDESEKEIEVTAEKEPETK